MTSKLETLREIIRELIRKELEEANTTASVGGQYSTPHAFRADEKDDENELKLSDGMSVVKKLSESTFASGVSVKPSFFLFFANFLFFFQFCIWRFTHFTCNIFTDIFN